MILKTQEFMFLVVINVFIFIFLSLVVVAGYGAFFMSLFFGGGFVKLYSHWELEFLLTGGQIVAFSRLFWDFY